MSPFFDTLHVPAPKVTDMSKKKDKFEIAKDVYIMNTSGTAPNKARIRRQADADARRIRELFDNNIARVVPVDAPEPA